MNLENLLKLTVGAQVMLTKNIDTDDKLVNVALGKVMGFQDFNEQVAFVHVEFNDESAERNFMELYDVSRRSNRDPIK